MKKLLYIVAVGALYSSMYATHGTTQQDTQEIIRGTATVCPLVTNPEKAADINALKSQKPCPEGICVEPSVSKEMDCSSGECKEKTSCTECKEETMPMEKQQASSSNLSESMQTEQPSMPTLKTEENKSMVLPEAPMVSEQELNF